MDDVNERVVDEWVEETTPWGRVWEVANKTYEYQSVKEIAERARVKPDEAETHLNRLVLVGVAEQVDSKFRRPPESVAVGAALRLLDETDPEVIADRMGEFDDDATSRRHRATAQLALDIHAAADIIEETNG